MSMQVPRQGESLAVRKRLLPFSFFPATRGNRRYGLFDTLFAVSPWAVMQAAVRETVPAGIQRDESQAFLEQAQGFYSAATSGGSANPLLYYYAFLNVGKALLRTRGFAGSLDQAMHGLSAQTAAGGMELADSEIVVKDTPGLVNVYAELVDRLGFTRPANNTVVPVTALLPQVVVGHRVWRQGLRQKERFVSIHEIQVVHAAASRAIWLRLYLTRGDLSRYEISRSRLLQEGDLNGVFSEVDVAPTGRNPQLMCLEQILPVIYTGRPTDVVMNLVDLMRPRLWRVATTLPDGAYRKYYLHLTPPTEANRIPQIATLWLLFYYFGSIVRYRPHLYRNVINGPYGAFVAEYISQADQLLYFLASEMAQREVAKPAII